MKITKLETFLLQAPLAKAMGCSTLLYGFRDTLLIKLSTDSGLHGWGETAPVGGLQAMIEEQMAPQLIGQNPLEYRKIWRNLWGANFGNGLAVAGIDIALNDLRGKALKVPLNVLFGGKFRDRVPAYASCMNYTEGIDPEQQYPGEAREMVQKGFKALKMRIGRFPHRRELPMIASVREAVGPDIRLMADGNGAYTVPTAITVGRELDKLGFYWFEEPLPEGHGRYPGYDILHEKLDISLAGGEVLDSRGEAKELLMRNLFDVIQPDTSLDGGIAETLFVAEMAREFGVMCNPHCWGGAIVVAATTHLLSCVADYHWGFTTECPMLELDAIDNPFRTELSPNPVKFEDGFVIVPEGPGLGIEINEEILKKYRKK